MPSKKKTSKRKPARPAGNQHLRIALSALFLLGFLILSLVLLAEWRESTRSSAPPSSQKTKAVSGFEGVRVRIVDAMVRSGITPRPLPPGAGDEPAFHELEEEFPDGEALDELGRQLAALSPRLGLEPRPESYEVNITWDDDLRYRLRFALPAPSAERMSEKARVAIIMDDLGGDMASARELLQIDLPVTFAVLPNTERAARVATLAYRRGREVIVHLPMEPRDYPARDPGYEALLLDLEPEEIRRRMAAYLDRIPYAVGGNNHMGSRFTESRKAMTTVLTVMKEEGLFFVDSLTTSRSVAFAEARRLGIPAAARDVFLDNDRDVEKIARQIRALVDLAVSQGQAVGICHPYPETLEALRQSVPVLSGGAVEMVSVSRLLER